MNLSEEQQRVVLNNTNNLVVTAGAGAGKTFVLTKRFLQLLKANHDIDITQILALTFTNKAATEMLERIRNEINTSDDPHIKKQKANLSKTTIATLDSFSLSIVSGFFYKYGLPSNACVDDDRSNETTKAVIFEWLRKYGSRDAVSTLIDNYKFNKLYEHEKYLLDFAKNNFSLVKEIDFNAIIMAQLAQAHRDINDLKSRMAFIVCEINKLFLNIKEGRKTVDENRVFFSKECKFFYDNWDSSDSEKLSKILMLKLPKQIPSNTKGVTEVNEYYKEFKSLLEKVKKAISFVQNEKNYKELFSLLNELQKSCLLKRREEGLVSYLEIAKMAVDLLTKDKNLRQYYKEKFRYIMIDEFQDNNKLQRDLLFLLSEKNELSGDGIPTPSQLATDKLFFVGDQKQSIYRFRGADVSVFKTLGKELREANGVEWELSKNYRSEPGLINYFNSLFEMVFKSEDGSPKSYEAEFCELSAREPKTNQPASVAIIEVTKSEDEECNVNLFEMEARAIARTIKKWRGVKEVTDKKIKDGKQSRLCDYQDFALLLESKTRQDIYEKEFLQQGIPFVSLSVTTFFDGALCDDLLSILSLVLLPKNLVGYAAVLRSPFLSLDDDEVFAILLSEKKRMKDSSYDYFNINYEDVQFYLGQPIKEESKNALLRMGEVIDWLKKYADILPITTLVDTLWFEYGLSFAYLANPKFRLMSNHFDLFRQMAMKADAQHISLGEFYKKISFIKNSNGGNSNEKFDNPLYYSISPNSVTIMTIHKSKGLQFPIVVLPDSSIANREDPPYFWYKNSEHGPTIFFKVEDKDIKKSDYFYFKEKSKNSNENSAEKNRLLYVALTRAENHLLICGQSKNEKSFFSKIANHYKINGNSLNNFLLQVDYQEIPISQLVQKSTSDIDISFSSPDLSWCKNVSPVTLWYKKRNALSVTSLIDCDTDSDEMKGSEKSSIVNILTEDFSPGVSSCDNEPMPFSELSCDDYIKQEGKQNSFGTLCHNLLELIHNDVLQKESLSDYELVKKFVSALLDFEEKKRRVVLEAAKKLITSWLDSDEYRLLFNPLPLNCWCEKGFMIYFRSEQSSNDEPLYISGRADLLLEYEDKLLIIDYKTDIDKKEQSSYEAQLALYKKAFKEIFPSKQIESKIIWLRSYL